jgi:hypothetical protein
MKANQVRAYNRKTHRCEVVAYNVYNMFCKSMYVLILE